VHFERAGVEIILMQQLAAVLHTPCLAHSYPRPAPNPFPHDRLSSADLRQSQEQRVAVAVARNFRQGVRQYVAFLSVHSPTAALPSRPYNHKTS